MASPGSRSRRRKFVLLVLSALVAAYAVWTRREMNWTDTCIRFWQQLSPSDDILDAARVQATDRIIAGAMWRGGKQRLGIFVLDCQSRTLRTDEGHEWQLDHARTMLSFALLSRARGMCDGGHESSIVCDHEHQTVGEANWTGSTGLSRYEACIHARHVQAYGEVFGLPVRRGPRLAADSKPLLGHMQPLGAQGQRLVSVRNVSGCGDETARTVGDAQWRGTPLVLRGCVQGAPGAAAGQQWDAPPGGVDGGGVGGAPHWSEAYLIEAVGEQTIVPAHIYAEMGPMLASFVNRTSRVRQCFRFAGTRCWLMMACPEVLLRDVALPPALRPILARASRERMFDKTVFWLNSGGCGRTGIELPTSSTAAALLLRRPARSCGAGRLLVAALRPDGELHAPDARREDRPPPRPHRSVAGSNRRHRLTPLLRRTVDASSVPRSR